MKPEDDEAPSENEFGNSPPEGDDVPRKRTGPTKGSKRTPEDIEKMSVPRIGSSRPVTPGTVDDSRWLVKARNKDLVKLTDEMKDLYCERLLLHGKKMIAAKEIGVHYSSIEAHAKNDPDFAEDIQAALADRSQTIVQRLETEAMEGHVKLTYDKETGSLIAEETKYETPLRAMMLKRFDPDYKDRSEIDINIRGGVLVVPGRLAPEDWEAIFSPKKDPTQGGDA